MGRSMRMLFMVAIVAVSLAMGAARPGRVEDRRPDAAAAADLLSVRDFEQSGFFRRYRPVDTRRTSHGGSLLHAYLFEDPENPHGRILIELGPAADNVQFVTVVWHGEAIYQRASWTTLKSRFMADLVESTFPEIDYDELSQYVWEQQQRSYPEGVGAMPKGTLRNARVMAGASGSSLVVAFERHPKMQH
jgi:hypothetical protein